MELVFLVWALFATALAGLLLYYRFVYHPLLSPDWGHRVYGVHDEVALDDEGAHQLVLRAFASVGFNEAYTFDSGPTTQTVMQDGHTVINHMAVGSRLPANALSLAVPDPLAAARCFAAILRGGGHEATIYENVFPDLPPNHLVVIGCRIFTEWAVVFRLPLVKMPQPKKRPRDKRS